MHHAIAICTRPLFTAVSCFISVCFCAVTNASCGETKYLHRTNWYLCTKTFSIWFFVSPGLVDILCYCATGRNHFKQLIVICINGDYRFCSHITFSKCDLTNWTNDCSNWPFSGFSAHQQQFASFIRSSRLKWTG